MDLLNAARRHLEAAELLDQPNPQGRRDVAGYLYGIAAECSLKAIMWKSGMRQQPNQKDDPFFLTLSSPENSPSRYREWTSQVTID